MNKYTKRKHLLHLFSFFYPSSLRKRWYPNFYRAYTTELYEQAIKYEHGSFITASGALATLSGAKTGRAPRDKRVVKDETTTDELWWGK